MKNGERFEGYSVQCCGLLCGGISTQQNKSARALEKYAKHVRQLINTQRDKMAILIATGDRFRNENVYIHIIWSYSKCERPTAIF